MKDSCKLTKRFVEGIKPEQSTEILAWDSELRGFGVRVFSTGRRTYFVQYRNQSGRTRRKKIGVHGHLTAEQAREEAKKILGQVASGEDPSEVAKVSKAEAKATTTVLELTKAYLEQASAFKRANSLCEDERNISLHVIPRIGHMGVQEVSHEDIQKLHRDMQDKPYAANRVRALLCTMFNQAIKWRWISVNPVHGVGKYQEQKRHRWLDDEEMTRIWQVLDKYDFHLTSFVFKFLLLTGARKSEVLNASWDQIDLNKGVWTKPSHLTKQKKTEHLPLSSSALEMLNDLKRFHPSDSPFLFPGKVEGKPLQEIKTFWKSVLNEAGIENCRIHDLRHTHASHLVSSGLSLSIVGKLLGHTQASTTQRYAHLADEPLREAAELFGSKVGKKTAR